MKRPGDRHAKGGKGILLRPSEEQRAELEAAVKALGERSKVPGARVTLSGFVLDVALDAARDIIRKGK